MRAREGQVGEQEGQGETGRRTGGPQRDIEHIMKARERPVGKQEGDR